jgi:NCS1 family nucleobase:cation symporter-1
MDITPVPADPLQAPAVVIPSALSQLYNQDLAPTQPEGRTWGTFSLFAMWMSDVHSVGGYAFAASLFFLGLAGWQMLLSMSIIPPGCERRPAWMSSVSRGGQAAR